MRGAKALLWAALACFLVGIAPFVSVLLASWIADAHGCRLDEGSVHACMVLGSDWGGTLYAMGVMGWLMLLSIWPLLLSPLLLIAGLLARRAARRR